MSATHRKTLDECHPFGTQVWQRCRHPSGSYLWPWLLPAAVPAHVLPVDPDGGVVVRGLEVEKGPKAVAAAQRLQGRHRRLQTVPSCKEEENKRKKALTNGRPRDARRVTAPAWQACSFAPSLGICDNGVRYATKNGASAVLVVPTRRSRGR